MVQYNYDAWGNHKVLNASGIEIVTVNDIGNLNPFRYRGYYYDTETGLYYLQTRYYDPVVGRFISRDNIEYADPESINGINLYAYCGNNPVKYVDPNGTLFILTTVLIFLGIGAVAGGIVGGVTAAQSGSNVFLGILTGAFLGGAVGAIVGLGGAFLAGGLSAILSKFISDVAASIFSQSWAFGTWEDYATAFIFGGFLKGFSRLKNSNRFNNVIDIGIVPLVSQLAKMGTRGNQFDMGNYFWNVVSRGIANSLLFDEFIVKILNNTLSFSFSKSII